MQSEESDSNFGKSERPQLRGKVKLEERGLLGLFQGKAERVGAGADE